MEHVGVDKCEHERDNALMDTKKITSELLASGLTQKELANLVPCGQSTIAAYLSGARGHRLSKEIGDKLEALHLERCSVKRPRRAATPP